MIEDEKYFMGRDILNQCYSYNQLYHFYRELGLKGIDRYINELQNESKTKSQEIERLNNKYNKALELLIDYNLPCEVDDFMNVHSDYCETHCGVDEEQYKRCWDKFIEWKLGSDKE